MRSSRFSRRPLENHFLLALPARMMDIAPNDLQLALAVIRGSCL
jgi:hypothetical protein